MATSTSDVVGVDLVAPLIIGTTLGGWPAASSSRSTWAAGHRPLGDGLVSRATHRDVAHNQGWKGWLDRVEPISAIRRPRPSAARRGRSTRRAQWQRRVEREIQQVQPLKYGQCMRGFIEWVPSAREAPLRWRGLGSMWSRRHDVARHQASGSAVQQGTRPGPGLRQAVPRARRHWYGCHDAAMEQTSMPLEDLRGYSSGIDSRRGWRLRRTKTLSR